MVSKLVSNTPGTKSWSLFGRSKQVRSQLPDVTTVAPPTNHQSSSTGASHLTSKSWPKHIYIGSSPIAEIAYVAYFRKAQSLEAVGDWAGVIECYLSGLSRVVKLYPNSNDHVFGLTQLGLAFTELRQFDKARTHLKECLEIRRLLREHSKSSLLKERGNNFEFCEMQLDLLDDALHPADRVARASNGLGL